MDLKLRDLVVFDHFSVLKTKVTVIFRGLRVDGLEHTHRLQGVELFFGKLHHFHFIY